MSNLIELKSPEGQSLLEDCQRGKSGSVFQPYVHAVFNKQVGKSSCGIQSSAIILAASQLGKNSPLDSANALAKIPKAQQPITEETMFEYEGTTNAVTLAEINNNGCTLDQLSAVLLGHGREILKVFASDVDVNKFRDDAKRALSSINSSSGVVVNYHMGTLGQGTVYGHHSPLAAYHVESDRFLIMDTWYDTQECWAKTEDILKAMNTVDSASNKKRGYCIVN